MLYFLKRPLERDFEEKQFPMRGFFGVHLSCLFKLNLGFLRGLFQLLDDSLYHFSPNWSCWIGWSKLQPIVPTSNLMN